MKNIKFILMLLIATFIFSNCASVVEISDAWQGENFNTLNDQKVLVISKSSDKVAKERFEKDLADRLRKAGVNAVESFIAFPDMKQKKRTPKEVDLAIKKITEAGFRGVVITGVKNKITESESSTTGGYDREVNTGRNGLAVQFFRSYGFGSFYGGTYNSDLGSVYVDAETTTNSYDVYTIETVTYNLTLPKENQMIGVLVVKVTDPTSYAEVADKYTRIIAKQFKKGM